MLAFKKLMNPILLGSYSVVHKQYRIGRAHAVRGLFVYMKLDRMRYCLTPVIHQPVEPGIILSMGSDNERPRYFATTSLIGLAHSLNGSWEHFNTLSPEPNGWINADHILIYIFLNDEIYVFSFIFTEVYSWGSSQPKICIVYGNGLGLNRQ